MLRWNDEQICGSHVQVTSPPWQHDGWPAATPWAQWSQWSQWSQWTQWQWIFQGGLWTRLGCHKRSLINQPCGSMTHPVIVMLYKLYISQILGYTQFIPIGNSLFIFTTLYGSWMLLAHGFSCISCLILLSPKGLAIQSLHYLNWYAITSWIILIIKSN
jgi:hypothetical protein